MILEDYATYLREEQKRPDNTVKAYVSDVRQFLKCVKKQPRYIREDHIREWQREISSMYSPSTISRKLSAVNSFFTFAQKRYGIYANPCDNIERPKTGIRLPKSLSQVNITKLINSPGEDTPEAIRDKALLHFLYTSGVRISELVSIDLIDLEDLVEERYVTVVGKGNKERGIPIVITDTIEIMERYLHNARPMLAREGETAAFVSSRGTRIHENTVRAIIKKYKTKERISSNVTPHTFRHSIATHLHDAGVDIEHIRQFLGHQDISITKIYLRSSRHSLQSSITATLANSPLWGFD